MILGVNIISGKAGGVLGKRKFLGSKDHLDWLKIDLNTAETITVQDCKCTKVIVNGSTLKLRVNMSQRYNDNTKRSKLMENQLGILIIYVFCWKIQQRASGQVESAIGVTYLREYTRKVATSPPPPPKVVTT